MFFVNCVGVRVHVRGIERIPKGACIFAANHTSSADAPAVVLSNGKVLCALGNYNSAVSRAMQLHV